jgi:hypothetical protein
LLCLIFLRKIFAHETATNLVQNRRQPTKRFYINIKTMCFHSKQPKPASQV